MIRDKEIMEKNPRKHGHNYKSVFND